MCRAGIGHQGDLPGLFYGIGEFSLMPGTVTIYTSGNDLAPLGNKVSQGPDFLVVDYKAFISAEPAYLLPGEYSFFRWHCNSS